MESTKAYTSESGEVFSKQALSLSSEGHKNTSKQKRRDRVMRPKHSGNKSRRYHGTATAIMMQIKHKQELLQASEKENPNSVSHISKSRITQKLGIYNKGKASETVGRRRPLGDVNMKISEQSGTTMQKDIRRALGLYSPTKQRSQPLQEHNRQLKTSPIKLSACSPNHTAEGEMSGTDMECSPQHVPRSHVPLKEIAQRLSSGLQPVKVFAGNNYLKNVKAELRKVMKQSDPDGYSELMQCLVDDEPMVDGSLAAPPEQFNVQPSPSTAADPLSSLALLFASDTDAFPSTADFVEVSTQLQPAMITANVILPPPAITEQEVWVEPIPNCMDFIDLLDNQPQPLQTKPSSPSSRWMPTPDRPKMFPRKLY